MIPPMDKRTFIKTAVAAAATGLASRPAFTFAGTARAAVESDWDLEIDVIEACSCRMFCQCFFTGSPLPPAAHMDHGPGAEHFCRFNQAYQVRSGHYHDLALTGAKFWYTGDAGSNLREAKWDWAVLTFDSALAQPQRDALWTMLQSLRFYRPERWHSQSIAEPAPIEWALTDEGARATLGGGAIAELSLKRLKGQHAGPVVLQNLGYFGYPRNNGFALMPTQVQAYRTGERAFEYSGTNGFVTTVRMTAEDIAARSR